MIDRIEESTDVGIKDPVHLLSHDPFVECVQRIVLAASRSEAIGKTQEVSLVDLIEHRNGGLLCNLILQGRDTQRPQSAVCFRDMHPSRRLCSVRVRVDPIASPIWFGQVIMYTCLLSQATA